MKRYLTTEEVVDNNLKVNDDFDCRWDEYFGEPTTEVFEVEDFKKFMQGVIDFE